MRLRSFLSILSIFTLLISQGSHAITNTDDIRAAIEGYTATYIGMLSQQYPNAAQIDYKIGALDSRLKMADCSVPLTVNKRSNADIGRINVKVSCTGARQWSLYAPLDISVFHPIVVSAAPISSGIKLKKHHLSLKNVDISRIRGSYFYSPADIINMETKRQLTPGVAISSSNLRRPMTVNKGDKVILSAELGAMSVKTPAIALSNGRLGEQIRVQNKRSKRVIDARITGPNTVRALL